MQKIRWIGSFLVALTLWSAAGAWAAANDKVRVKTLTSVDKVRQGSTFHVAVVLDIGEGWHAYDNLTKKPYVATNLELTPPKGISVKKVEYPKGEKKNFKGLGEATVYEGRAIIGATLTAARNASLGKQTLKAALSYQVCNDTTCLRPMRGKPINITVQVVKPNTPVKQLHKVIFSKPPFRNDKGAWRIPSRPVLATITPAPLVLSVSGIIESIAHQVEQIGDHVKTQLSEGQLTLPVIFLLWVGGILSAFSPCVIPIIPMTIAFFGNQSQQAGGRAKTLLLALFYMAGITAFYSVVGVAAVLAGKTLSFLLQGPFLWLFVVVVLGAMGLSMLGLFEIPVPAFITSVAGARTGFVGAFIMGLVASVLFLPCTGPVAGGMGVGLAALARNEGSTWTLMKTGLAAFNLYAVGLGTPFLVLALLSGSAMKAPRSGDWTLAVKRIFGMVFLGLALYFMNYVPHTVLMATFLVGCGIYLAFFEKALGVRPTGKLVRWASAVTIVGIGIMIALPKKGGAAPPGNGGRAKPVVMDAKEIAWQPYTDQLLEHAAKESKPVMIDFTADW